MISIIFFTFLLSHIECYPPHARVGNYSQYIPDYYRCGLSRDSLKTPDKCFKYHQNMFAPLSHTRNVLEGESPWTVLVQCVCTEGTWPFREECTGSLIHPQWVVTSAHCFDLKGIHSVNIFFGTEFETGESISSSNQIRHPLYNESTGDFDIILVQLNKPAKIVREEGYYRINTLCLPPNNITLKILGWTSGVVEKERAFTSGWGNGHENHLRIASRMFTHLYRVNRTFFRQQALLDNIMVCAGDSGSPTWQYFMGRAVLLGVIRGGDIGNQCSIRSYGVYIPKFVDWIIQTIKQ